MSRPFVSCVMPTFDRRRFVLDAIACYRSQTYPNRELVIADDGTDPIGDLVPDDATIRYVRLPERLSTGAKRNAACRAARGEIIVHWDDDDWSAPDRVDVQVAALLATGADVCGLKDLLFYEPATDRGWHYRYPARARPWVAGGTMCYRRSLWEVRPFPDVRQGEDTQFVWSDRSLRIHAIDRPDLYIATIHAANTSAKRTAGQRWISVPGARIRAIRGSQPPARTADKKGEAEMAAPTAVPTSHVTVSIPHHGPGDHLRAAVDSILGQTHRDLSCVVVFDGDRAGADAIADIDDPRLVRHVLPENRGRYFADQVVLEATSSDFFLVQDSDDWSEPHRVERLLAELRRTGADVCVSDVVHHDRRSGGERISRHGWPRLHDPIGPALVHRAGHQGLYRTGMLRSIGGWYAGHRIGFDTSVLNFVMLAGGRVVSVAEPLYHRNIRSGSLSMSPATGWRTPERRRVVAELRTLHQRVFAATHGGTVPDAGSIIRTTVLAGRGPDIDALRQEAGRLSKALGPAPQNATVRERLPDVHEMLASRGEANSRWSISVMAALELYRRLSSLRPRRILDVGSGLSTVVEAIAAARYGGRVTALEHDPRHAERTTALLRSYGVDAVADVVVAPLVETSHPCGTGPWYDWQPDGLFDFIVVDGPPLGAGGRIAAFPAVAAHRRRSWELWLFDAHRDDEQRCLTAWAGHFRYAVSRERIDPTGVAVLGNPSRAGAAAPVLDRLGISLLTGGRPDLLERTLATFESTWPAQCAAAQVVALVNGPDRASREVLDRFGWVDRILTYERDVLTIGTATSIVVAAVTGHPDVEYVLHLEDDWETRTVDVDALVRGADFLRAAGAGQVRLRHRSEPSLPQHMISGQTIAWQQHDDHRRGAAHFTFNPSLITRDLADRVFPAADERDAQRRFLATGLDIVHLEPGAFVHIGGHSRRLQLGRR